MNFPFSAYSIFPNVFFLQFSASIDFVYSLHTVSLTCPMCKRLFKNYRSRLLHTKNCALQMKANNPKKFNCNECDSRFSSYTYLQCHTMVVHRGVSPFKCQFCGKGFTTALILKNHVRTHTGDRPFVCTICGRGFAQQSTLVKHGKTHTKWDHIQNTTSV